MPFVGVFKMRPLDREVYNLMKVLKEQYHLRDPTEVFTVALIHMYNAIKNGEHDKIVAIVDECRSGNNTNEYVL
jgi:hypothetical protein